MLIKNVELDFIVWILGNIRVGVLEVCFVWLGLNFEYIIIDGSFGMKL